MQLVWDQLEAMLADLTAAAASFDPSAVYIGIYTAITPHGVNTVLTDLTTPPVADIPRVAVTTWGAAYRLSDGRVARDSPIATFVPGGGTTSVTVAGWYLADASTSGNLIAYQAIAAPVSLPSADYQWSLVLRLTVDPSGRWDASLSWNG